MLVRKIEEMSLGNGVKVGPYTILAAIGAGGMGEVYRARDDRLGRDVALKILPEAMKSDPDRLRRFALEARAAGSLDHPNIIAVHDFNDTAEHPYIVTELLEGATLRDHLRGAPLPVRKALLFASQIARALAAAHEKGIIHRDLKPENLFVLADGRIKILDFGLAKNGNVPANGSSSSGARRGDTISATDHTSTGAVLGSAGYMSPEQVQGHPADHRSDLFSFGAVVYEMLSGRRTFDGETHVERAYAILKDHPPSLCDLNREISPLLDRVVMRCLEKSPAQRFQSAQDLAFELELALDRSHTAVLPPLKLRGRRRPFLLAAGFVASAGVLFAFGRMTSDSTSTARAAGTLSPEIAHYKRVTFRRQWVGDARFAPDGRSVIYSAAYGGDRKVFISQLGNPEERPLSPANMGLLAVSSRGEMAMGIYEFGSKKGLRLARAPISGGTPREVIDHAVEADFSADGGELAVTRYVDGKWRIEYPLGKVLAVVEGQIASPRLSPRGDMIAYMNWPVPEDDRGSVEVMDLQGRRKTLSGPWLSARGLAWSPDGQEIWFTASRSRTYRSIYAVTLDGRERLVAETAGSMILNDIAPDGRVLVTRTSCGSTMYVGGKDDKPRDMSWFDHSIPIDLNRDGTRMLFIEAGEATPTEMTTYFRDLDGSPAVRLGTGKALAISPDGEWALIAPRPSEPELRLVPMGPGLERTVPAGPAATYQTARFFPDGKRAVIGAALKDGQRQVFLQNLDGTDPVALTPPGHALVGRPSPDGKYVLAKDAKRRLLKIDVETHEMVEITGIETDRIPIRWTRDGRGLIVLRAAFEFPLELKTFDLESSTEAPYMEIETPDSAGLPQFKWIVMAPEADVFAYPFDGSPSELYLIENLH